MGSKRQRPCSKPCRCIHLIQSGKLSSSRTGQPWKVLHPVASGLPVPHQFIDLPHPPSWLLTQRGRQWSSALTVALTAAGISQLILAIDSSYDCDLGQDHKPRRENWFTGDGWGPRVILFWPWFITGGQRESSDTGKQYNVMVECEDSGARLFGF